MQGSIIQRQGQLCVPINHLSTSEPPGLVSFNKHRPTKTAGQTTEFPLNAAAMAVLNGQDSGARLKMQNTGETRAPTFTLSAHLYMYPNVNKTNTSALNNYFLYLRNCLIYLFPNKPGRNLEILGI